ncbi:MAG: hypothetical protein HZY76_03290 [Anaerolineae bacterium]|nr:MAG: hypothetical protein HZY76_03290 [Anaerolineae bacterium]
MPYDLRLAQFAPNGWFTQTIDSAGDVGAYASLVLDSAGRPIIACADRSRGDLKLARWTGSAWTVATTDGRGRRCVRLPGTGCRR